MSSFLLSSLSRYFELDDDDDTFLSEADDGGCGGEKSFVAVLSGRTTPPGLDVGGSVDPRDDGKDTLCACPSPCTALLPGADVVLLALVDPGLVQHAGHLLSTEVLVPCLGLVWLHRAVDGVGGHLVVVLPDLGGRGAVALDSHVLDLNEDWGEDDEEENSGCWSFLFLEGDPSPASSWRCPNLSSSGSLCCCWSFLSPRISNLIVRFSTLFGLFLVISLNIVDVSFKLNLPLCRLLLLRELMPVLPLETLTPTPSALSSPPPSRSSCPSPPRT